MLGDDYSTAEPMPCSAWPGNTAGDRAYQLATELFPICRSITGPGVRLTLAAIQRQLPQLTIHEVPTGTQCFDWTVPREWSIRDAYIEGPDGHRVVDFADSNLHVLNYSAPIDTTLSLEELRPHLYSIPEMPDAIPYVTSYYKERWGFCLTHRQLQALKPGLYKVKIDSALEDGSLSYGELRLPGRSSKEILLSTYVCHPSLGNNELSGPVVTVELARWLAGQSSRRYSYRIVFVPETIGSIVYLSHHLADLKRNVFAGFNITCVGDERAYSFLPSRKGRTPADRAALHALRHHAGQFVRYSYLDRGSDERQYCSPGIDLPIASIMRTKYGEYPEYHTSLDDLRLISPAGLGGAITALAKAISTLECNRRYRTTVLGEPQLGRRGLYPTLGTREGSRTVRNQTNLLAYSDGEMDLLAIAELLDIPAWDLASVANLLREHGLLAEEDNTYER